MVNSLETIRSLQILKSFSLLSINGSDPLQDFRMFIVEAFTQTDEYILAVPVDNRLHDRSHVPFLELAHPSVHSLELVLEVDPPPTIFFADMLKEFPDIMRAGAIVIRVK
jgi:hypothetical protein